MKIHLRTVSFIFLAVMLALSAVLISSTIRVPLQFSLFEKHTTQFQKVAQASISLQEASDYLTDESRLFVISGEWRHLENYFAEVNESKRREKAIDEIKSAGSLEESTKFLEMALQKSKELEGLECKAMKLVVVAKGYDKDPSYKVPQAVQNVELSNHEIAMDYNTKMAAAWLILFSDQYFSMKKAISIYRTSAVDEILKHSAVLNENNTKKLKAAFYITIAEITLIVLFSLAFFIIMMFFVVKSLYAFTQSIKKNQKLDATQTKELEILRETYNEMFDIAMAKENFLREKAEHDELTGLINRTAFRAIAKELKGAKTNVAFIIIDVDKFKEINDRFGHPAGDKVLKTVAQILKTTFRSTDYAARIGGDEFAVLLTKCCDDNEATKRMIAEKMKTLFEKVEEQCVNDIPHTTLSCGIAISNKGWEESLVDQADNALYIVKRAGRNGYKFAE